MSNIVYIFQNTAYYLLGALEICFFARAILSFIDPMAEGALSGFVISVTEPIIYPVRCLLSKISSLEALPVDISFMVTYMLIAIIRLAIVLHI